MITKPLRLLPLLLLVVSLNAFAAYDDAFLDIRNASNKDTLIKENGIFTTREYPGPKNSQSYYTVTGATGYWAVNGYYKTKTGEYVEIPRCNTWGYAWFVMYHYTIRVEIDNNPDPTIDSPVCHIVGGTFI